MHLPGIYHGLLFGKPGSDTQIYDSSTYVKNYTYLGTVAETDGRGLGADEQKNKFSVGETIEIMKPDGRNVEVTVKGIFREDGEGRKALPIRSRCFVIDLDGRQSRMISKKKRRLRGRERGHGISILVFWRILPDILRGDRLLFGAVTSLHRSGWCCPPVFLSLRRWYTFTTGSGTGSRCAWRFRR